MKKRLLLLVIVLVVAFTCLAACGANQSTLDTISKQLKMSYSKIVINISTTSNGVTLSGRFDVSFNGDTTTIDFQYEQLSKFDGSSAPSGFKTTVTGRATVVGSNVTVEGDTDELPWDKLTMGFTFKSAFFKHVKTADGIFEADVSNPQGFVGDSNFVGSGMHVYVKYGSVLTQLRLRYTDDKGAAVAIYYTYEV